MDVWLRLKPATQRSDENDPLRKVINTARGD
jgi:hypothetical protein